MIYYDLTLPACWLLACRHTYADACICLCIRMYVYACVCICRCMCVYMHVHVYMYMQMHLVLTFSNISRLSKPFPNRSRMLPPLLPTPSHLPSHPPPSLLPTPYATPLHAKYTQHAYTYIWEYNYFLLKRRARNHVHSLRRRTVCL